VVEIVKYILSIKPFKDVKRFQVAAAWLYLWYIKLAVHVHFQFLVIILFLVKFV